MVSVDGVATTNTTARSFSSEPLLKTDLKENKEKRKI